MRKYEELLNYASELLESGECTGCDGTVVVGHNQFKHLQDAVLAETGVVHGVNVGELICDDCFCAESECDCGDEDE